LQRCWEMSRFANMQWWQCFKWGEMHKWLASKLWRVTRGEWHKSSAWVEGTRMCKVKKFKNLVEPGFMEFYANVVLPLSGLRRTHSTWQQAGATVEDFEDTSELDPAWTKQQLSGRYYFDLGYMWQKGVVWK
jgi:hypothetical protein